MTLQTPPAHQYGNLTARSGHLPKNQALLPGYNKKASVTLGSAQVAFGTIAFIAGCFTLITRAMRYWVGYGQWGGLFVFIVGTFGIAAGRRKTRDSVMAYLVCSLLGLIVCTLMGCLAAFALNVDMAGSCGDPYYYYNSTNAIPCVKGDRDGAIASESVILGMSVMGVISLICSAIVASYVCHPRNIKYGVSFVLGSNKTGITQLDGPSIFADRPMTGGEEYPRPVHPASLQATYACPTTIPSIETSPPIVVQTASGPLMLRPAVLPQDCSLPRVTSSNSTRPTILTLGTTDPSSTTTPTHSDLPPPYNDVVKSNGALP